jgi:serine/threonine protein phosphatase 1
MLKRLFAKRPAPSLPPGRRVYAVGDIHGRLDLFDALLGSIATDNAKRCAAHVDLILLGDLIDRGPESAGVVRRAMEKPAWVTQLVALMGNHEEAMVEALNGNLDMARIWLRVGGQAALTSWGIDFSQLDEAHTEEIIVVARRLVPQVERAWLSRMRTSYTLGDYHFVHAGVRPGIALSRQTTKDAYWIRDDFLASRAHHGAMIVHGHSISPDVETLDNRIGIDTGAYVTGRLTALCLEGSDRWLLQTG